MKWYVFKRTVWAGVATLIILTITFILMYVTPDHELINLEFEVAAAGGDARAAVEARREARGLDQPFHVQYIEFMSNMASGNWGWSRTRSQPVTEAMAQAIPYSLMYGVPATILSIIFGITIGLYSAMNQYTKSDYVATFFAFFGFCIPNFWFAIILLVFFGVYLDWVDILFDHNAPRVDGEWKPFTLAQWQAIFSTTNVKQYILPTFVLMTGATASLMRYSRAEALEYIDAEFVKTARAKGVKERTILYKHIMRPASVPIATILVGDILGIIFVGSYLIEVVFGIPGLGLLSFNAIINQDTALVFGTIFVPVFIAIIGNLAQDIAYVYLDPRIDYGDR